ncbi:MAG: DUF6913 domain-containing protein [Candidatus Marivariicella sp.]|nr:hypothetical protein [Flavobacteriaceae bacterium]|tara:strand:- start:71 stop:583 length:513 start_codon:yes stop_codon:yes gene_type:complete
MKNELKKIFLKFFYDRKLNNLQKKTFKKTKKLNPKILILIDKNLNIKIKDLSFFNEIFSIPQENINFLWFDSSFVFDYSNHLRIDIDDINFSGKIKNSFIDNKYDILFNLYERDNIFLKYLSVNIKNKFSIGFLTTDTKLNDLVFNFSPNDLNSIKKEIPKYYNVINNHI